MPLPCGEHYDVSPMQVAVRTSRRWDAPEIALVFLVLVIGFLAFADNGLRVDEQIHFDQIGRIATGSGGLNEGLTMLPGFHALVAGLTAPFGGPSEFGARLASLVLSAATVVAFYALARTLQPDTAGIRLLQFAFLPILFPQFYLIYTDVAAMLFVLLMMLASAVRKDRVAGVLGLAAIAVRQNAIVWVAFVFAWSYVRDYGLTVRPVSQVLARFQTFAMTAGLFALFVVINGGQIALGDAKAHPLGTLHLTNIFFALFLSCFVFLPLWWGARGSIAVKVRAPSTWLWGVALLAVFWLGFENSHPYNQDGGDFYLRNAILIWASASTTNTLLFFLPVALGALGLWATPLREPRWLVYGACVVVLLPEWLVEQRYYLMPMALFLLTREATGCWSERAQVAIGVVGSAALFVVVERGWLWM